MTMTAEQLALREAAANLKDVSRHSVDGYGRQDIHYNDPEGEFVFYSDYATLLDELERKDKRIAKLKATEQHSQRGWKEAHEQESRAEAAEKHIAELEARKVTVKLPQPIRATALGRDFSALQYSETVKLLRDAGVNLTVEGNDGAH